MFLEYMLVGQTIYICVAQMGRICCRWKGPEGRNKEETWFERSSWCVFCSINICIESLTKFGFE